MKKSVLALALFGGAMGMASAQSNVTIYGIVDAGIVVEKGGPDGSVTKLTSGVASASRIGFRGTEDLGGGLSANFVLENGFNEDTGAMTGGLLFGRQAYVGLKGGFGAVNLGRQYTPHYLVGSATDPFGNGMAGKFTNLVTTTVRVDNAVKYTSPVFSGFSTDLVYGFGEQPGDSSRSRLLGASAGYTAGPLKVGLGYNRLDNAAGTGKTRSTILGATYNFGVAIAHAAYNVNKADAAGVETVDSKDMLVGVTVPFGPHKLMASYIRKDDDLALNRDSNQLAIGYSYALSKRTDFYAAYGRIDNKNGATYTVGNNTEPGSGDKAYNLGVRHSF